MVIPSIANCTRFYALPEIHKLTLILHPLVSNANNSPYRLTRFLSQSLSHLTYNNFCAVKNSSDFVDKLKNISLPQTILCFLLM